MAGTTCVCTALAHPCLCSSSWRTEWSEETRLRLKQAGSQFLLTECICERESAHSRACHLGLRPAKPNENRSESSNNPSWLGAARLTNSGKAEAVSLSDPERA